VAGPLLSAHTDANSESESSDEELSLGTEAVCLGCLVNMVGFPTGLLVIEFLLFKGIT
jgi:hypothetical protein